VLYHNGRAIETDGSVPYGWTVTDARPRDFSTSSHVRPTATQPGAEESQMEESQIKARITAVVASEALVATDPVAAAIDDRPMFGARRWMLALAGLVGLACGASGDGTQGHCIKS
jgi:hypothetical protein